jgi:hypothetical protein
MEMYETREAWLNACIMAHRPQFEAAGFPLPLNIRASIGFPSTGIRSSAIGEIIFPESSADNHYEIFINPTLKDGTKVNEASIADTLTHELCHCALDYNLSDRTHDRKSFGKLAKDTLGLQGDCKATYAGERWHSWGMTMLDELGPIPHGEITLTLERKKVPTWGIKTECPDCGWLARVSKKHIINHTYLNCPVPDCNGILIAHFDA